VEVAVEVRGVTRWFGSLRALHDVDLDVRRGEVTGLLGHNGAGKTTLTRVLTGLLRPHGGGARVLGLDPHVDGSEVRRRIGVLGEAPGLDALLTVKENLQTRARVTLGSAAPDDAGIARLLEQLGLSAHTDRRVRGLSAGLRQRVALARALVTDPELLLLDEPATNMDPVAARQVRDLMRYWAHDLGRTVVVCTHDLAEAGAACDRVAVLEHGEVKAFGRPAELAAALGREPSVVVSTTAAGATAAADLLTRDGLRRCRVEGERLTVTPVTHDDVPLLVAELVGAGIPIHGVVSHAATLEDAYVAMHQGVQG
jgi:ABC-2 type transport system ATP-binding protein